MLLHVNKQHFFENRIDKLAKAFITVKELTIISRKFNRDILAAKARNKDVSVGDTVMLLADDRITFTSRCVHIGS